MVSYFCILHDNYFIVKIQAIYCYEFINNFQIIFEKLVIVQQLWHPYYVPSVCLNPFSRVFKWFLNDFWMIFENILKSVSLEVQNNYGSNCTSKYIFYYSFRNEIIFRILNLIKTKFSSAFSNLSNIVSSKTRREHCTIYAHI